MNDENRITLYNARIAPNKELLVQMRANGASINALAKVCGVSLSSFKRAMADDEMFGLELERAYQANLQKVREALFLRATGKATTKTLTSTEDADGNVLSRQKQVRELPADIEAMRMVLMQAGEISSEPLVEIDARQMAIKSEELREQLNLRSRSSANDEKIKNEWKVR